MTKRHREPVTRRNVYLPPAVSRAADAAAEHEDRSFSAFVQEAIRERVNRILGKDWLDTVRDERKEAA